MLLHSSGIGQRLEGEEIRTALECQSLFLSLTTVYSGGEPAFEDTTDSSFPFNITVPLCHKATESFLLLLWTVPAFVAVWPSQLRRVGATLCCGARAPGLTNLWSWGSPALGADSVAVAHGLRCSAAGGIFPAQGSNPCLPHRQANSLTRSHRSSPMVDSIKYSLTLSSMRLKGLWC